MAVRKRSLGFKKAQTNSFKKSNTLNQSGSVLILTMVIAGLMSFIVFSMLNVRNHHLKQMSSIKQKLAAHLIMEAVGQRMKSAYDMYLPYEEGTTPPADACYGGEWQNITFFKSDVTAAQESAYFCFPKNGEICVQNPFNKNDTEACFSLQNFQNSGVAQVDGFKNQIVQNPQLNILKPNIDVAKSWNISSEQLQKWQTARLPVILQISAGDKAHADEEVGNSSDNFGFSRVVSNFLSAIFGSSNNQSVSSDENPGLETNSGNVVTNGNEDYHLNNDRERFGGLPKVSGTLQNTGIISATGIGAGTGAGVGAGSHIGGATGSVGIGAAGNNTVSNGSPGVGSQNQADPKDGAGRDGGLEPQVLPGVKVKKENRKNVTVVPNPWLAIPSDVPEMPNTSEVSKENIDMTCTGMNKCVKFTACLSKNCDGAKQVSQLFAFKSPRAKTVFPKTNTNLAAKVAEPTDELCWSAPAQFEGVTCTLTGPCTTEGAEGGSCEIYGGHADLQGGKSNEVLGPDLIRFNNRDDNGYRTKNPGTKRVIDPELTVFRNTSVGKAQCVRKPAGTCGSLATANLPSKCYTGFKLPESVGCHKEVSFDELGRLNRCEIKFNLSELEGFDEVAKNAESYKVSYRNGNYYSLNRGCSPIKTYANNLKNGEWWVVGRTSEGIARGEARKYEIDSRDSKAVMIKDNILSIVDGISFQKAYGNSVNGPLCIQDISIAVKKSNDPSCNLPDDEPIPFSPPDDEKPMD
jgi:hypothetical protein